MARPTIVLREPRKPTSSRVFGRRQLLFGVTLGALLGTACAGDDGSADGSTGVNPATETRAVTDGGSGTTVGDETATETGVSACADVPQWSAPDWDTNAAEALAIRTQLDTLTGDATMRGAETGMVVVASLSDLTDLWDGDPSLAAVANPGYVPIVEASFDEFIEVLAAGPQDLVGDDGSWTPGPAGGIWDEDARGINEGGLEVRQLVDKGGYSAGVLYSYAVGLTTADIDPGTIDAIAAAWGDNAQLDPEGELTDSASYSYQMGFHADMADALTDAKAFASTSECEVERDQALVRFFNLWEQTMYARLVFYANRAQGRLLTATTDAELAAVLHDLAEGLGVAAGFIGLPNPSNGPLSDGVRIVTDADVQTVTDAFGVDLQDLGASTTGLLLESLPDLETAVGVAQGVVMDVYGVDAATIATYAMPTPG